MARSTYVVGFSPAPTSRIGRAMYAAALCAVVSSACTITSTAFAHHGFGRFDRFKHAQHRRVDLAECYVIGRNALIAVAFTVVAVLVVAAVVASVAESSTVRGAAGAALVLAGVPAVGCGGGGCGGGG